MSKVELNDRFQRDQALISTIMDGDTVMMDVERGEYYGMGGVGSRIWELLESPISVQQIIHTLCDEFDVDEATCQSDVTDFLSQLSAQGVVHPVE